MLKRGDSGDLVRTLQHNLMTIGYPLPRFGADGGLGGETIAAVALFVRDHAAEADDDPQVVSDEEIALIAELATHVSAAPRIDPELFFDRRKHASQVHVYGRRSWKDIRGITLHQTACRMGEKPERFDGMGAHMTTTPGGRLMWLHDLEQLVVHGHGWNKQGVGIEMGGLYAGIKGDLRTVWNDPSTPQRELPQTPTPALIASSIAACEFIIETVARHGGGITHIVSHRQSIDDRESDPGEELWKSVGLYIRDKYGLSDNGGKPIGKGMPLPEAWGPDYKGVPYRS